MAALFVSLAIGYWVGKIQIGNFQLGGMTGALMDTDLKREARDLEATIGGSVVKLGPEQFEAFGRFRSQAFSVDAADAVGITVGVLEARFDVKVVQAAHLDKRISVSPDPALQTGYRLLLAVNDAHATAKREAKRAPAKEAKDAFGTIFNFLKLQPFCAITTVLALIGDYLAMILS